jgi:hypothetical protein
MITAENATKAVETTTTTSVTKPVVAKQVLAPKPSASAVTKKVPSAPRAVVKAPAKVSAKTTTRSQAKPAVKATVKAPVKAVAKPLPKAQTKTTKPAKEKKPKLVRDSFTIPKAEYTVLEDLKHRAGKLSTQIKKSELLRAGIMALAAMSDSAFVAALKLVPTIKTGRPAKS